jgi:hypothetical protein
MATYYNKKKPNWESLFLSLSLSLSLPHPWLKDAPHSCREEEIKKKIFKVQEFWKENESFYCEEKLSNDCL